MKKTPENLLALGMLFAVALVLSNVVAAKVVATDIPFPGGTLAFPGAVFCYAITFLATDVVGEVWGRREARAVVRWGFAAQVLAAALLLFTQALPAADARVQAAYGRLLGLNWVFAGSTSQPSPQPKARPTKTTVSRSCDVMVDALFQIQRRPRASGRRARTRSRMRWKTNTSQLWLTA